jgi:hypothetical protein
MTVPVVQTGYVATKRAKTKPYGSPIRVRLSRGKLAINYEIISEDEPDQTGRADSLNMRGAQIEITNVLAGLGYEPIDRWSAVESTANLGTASFSTGIAPLETDMVRHFR